MRISDWSSDVCSSDLAQPDQGGREPFLQPVPPYPGTDPLELTRHALEIIDRRSHPLPPFEALAAVLPQPVAHRGRHHGAPLRPGTTTRLQQGPLNSDTADTGERAGQHVIHTVGDVAANNKQKQHQPKT